MPARPSPGFATSTGTAAASADRAARVRFRRAVTLMLMTLALPGSAQLVAGNKRVGRIALRIWFLTLLTVLVTLVAVLVDRDLAFWLVSNTFAARGAAGAAGRRSSSAGRRCSWTPGGSATR